MAAILRSRRSFKPEDLPEVESYMKIGHAYLYLMSFCSTFYLKNWRSYGDFKIWPTFWPRDLVIWPSTYKKYTPMWWTRFHMWTKFRVNWSKTTTCIAFQTNRQTDRQTNKQTDKRTYLQISSKFWQVINRGKKWIQRVQNSPIPLIRGRRLRIWSQIKAKSNNLNFHKMAAIFMSQ